jgi:hypothetical protein
VVGMEKNILSEQSLYYGNVSMPKGFEIDKINYLAIFYNQHLSIKNFLFQKLGILNTYIREHINVEYNLVFNNKQTFGNIYKPNQLSKPLLNIDPVDLKNSPDYILVCMV